MSESESANTGQQRDRVARWIAVFSIIVAAIGAVVAVLSYRETVHTNKLSNKIEARELLNSALDIMGGKSGTESFLLPTTPPDEARRNVLELARRKIKKALDLAPDFYMAHEFYGLYLHLVGEPDDALEYHEKAIELNEDEGWPYADYANSLRAMNRHEDAIVALNNAIKLDPENPAFHRNLGLIYWDLGKMNKAKQHFANAKLFASRRGIELPFPDID